LIVVFSGAALRLCSCSAEGLVTGIWFDVPFPQNLTSRDDQIAVPIFQNLARNHPARRHDGFALSLRNVEDLLHERGGDVCHESIRKWVDRFGPYFTASIRKKRSHAMHRFTQWRWHLDEVFVKIAGETYYLWRVTS